MMDIHQVPSPCYVLDEQLFRRNLSLIRSVKDRAGVNIILAFKAFALWKAFPIVREYIPSSTASSLFEARLAYEEMGSPAHTYAPAYSDKEFPEILSYSSHITFNSLSQFHHHYPAVQASARKVSCGLRINPEYSDVETALYNPCAPGSRLGVTAALLGDTLPEGIEGLHFHTLCESSSYDLEKTLQRVEQRFGHLFPRLKWLNMGGGHLMTRQGYDVEHLVSLLRDFKRRYPHLDIILEPGSAFAWQTGVLVATVLDIVENAGIRTAPGKPTYRLGGNSCLSGDYMGDWSFDHELQVGERIVFEDMIHYTIVKTTMFNGISHPSLALWGADDKLTIWREYTYEDYKHRMA